MNMTLRGKLILIFVIIKVIPLVLITAVAGQQIAALSRELMATSLEDSYAALNDSAIENIERMSTDTAKRVADFLYERDDDIRYLSGLATSLNGDLQQIELVYGAFVHGERSRLVEQHEWVMSEDGTAWVNTYTPDVSDTIGESSNISNDYEQHGSSFHPRAADGLTYTTAPLYDEVTFVGLDGTELIRISTTSDEGSRKLGYADWFKTGELRDVTRSENTFCKAENYWDVLPELTADAGNDIYVSDVIGAYVGANFIGMYTEANVAKASTDRGYGIEFAPEEQAFAGAENPNGTRFEGIVRWATPVYVDGEKIGYVTLALDHDHIMEFVDHQTPMSTRYSELSSAYEGNYSFIWDYQCRSIAHPRHHSIYGFDPTTGDPEIPWLTITVFNKLLHASGLTEADLAVMSAEEKTEALKANWHNLINSSIDGQPVYDLIIDQPTFFNQARTDTSKPDPDHTVAPELTRLGYVGLDGRYLNNAPQCTGWLDLTERGGSGSLYILWSGLWKLNTAAAIPYYTGHYAPSAANDYSRVGFGFVAIGAGLEDFTKPAEDTAAKLELSVAENLKTTTTQLIGITGAIVVLVVFIAFWLASYITNRIKALISGVSRFRSGERQFRFDSQLKDEFGTLADSFDDMADSIVESVKGPLTITDTNLRIIYMNDYGLHFIGKELSEVVGTFYSDNSIYPYGSESCPITALQNGREASVYHITEFDRYMRGSASYFMSSSNTQIGFIITTADVTELSHKQLELEHAVEDAESANEHKGNFLARMSHEIRTPMNAIIGLTNIIDRKLDEGTVTGATVTEVKGHVKQLETSSKHLLGLLNDILDISKIEAGKIDITDDVVDLPKLWETVVGIIQPRCDEKHITFVTDFDAFHPATFISDDLRLRQVLINLLGNAVKFTPELGTITLSVKNLDRSDGKTLVRFAVQDTGIGISKESLDLIFRPFEQGGGLITKQYGGSGLGLAISRNIVNLLGSDITVQSEVGRGSEFSFSLWLRETADDTEIDDDIANSNDIFVGKRMLLVDDVEINRMIVASLLEETGLIIDEADDGVPAVKLFSEAPVGTYDIIFMDVQMPVMNGYDATAAIRALDRPDAKTIPIIALTANAFKDDIEAAIRYGMNAHIAKPVELEKMLEVLAKHLKNS
ncbi:MAG: response regulator [Oscillospiraceae bacterium]|jgi:signal transduction histidine kinase/HAMP domain-containing protein/ActR/RegA family two-component response regulator|nr:response regulator [Oscillospiraceae bacterium]